MEPCYTYWACIVIQDEEYPCLSHNNTNENKVLKDKSKYKLVYTKM